MNLVRAPISLYVVGGFLGSGKTTLLNRLLATAKNARVAVFVNDFGAINIDAALIKARADSVIRLTNGCICCQIGSDLTSALIAVIDSDDPPQAIVIEASGVSDPWRIAAVGLADAALLLESVIVMVDASAILEQCADPLLADSIVRQLRAADILLLNKCDLVDRAGLARVRAEIMRHAPSPALIECAFAQVPGEVIGWTEGAALKSAGGKAIRQSQRLPVQARNQASTPAHGELFQSYALELDEIVAEARLREMLLRMPEGTLRMKGFLMTENGLVLVQFSGSRGRVRRLKTASACYPLAITAIGLAGRFQPEALTRMLLGTRVFANCANAAIQK